jgi:predicted RNA-binding protein
VARYFLICASKDHVLKGVAGGFAQAGHGRKDFISKPAKGDWTIFYSSKDLFENGQPLQKFTAIGQVIDEEPYQPDTNTNFRPYRRNVTFSNSHEADIRPLIQNLIFIKNKEKWGFYLISGFREISKDDFMIIESAMKT